MNFLNIVKAKNTKAVQVGGASGSCLPKSQFDRKLAYEDAATGGSIMIFNEAGTCLKFLKTLWSFLLKNPADNALLAELEIQNCWKELK